MRRARLLVVAAAVLAAVVVLVALRAAVRRPQGDSTVGDWTTVGVAEGGSIPGYSERSRAELAGLPAGRPVYALVVFAEYLPPERLPEVLVGVGVASVDSRVPLPRVQTELIRFSGLAVAAGMDLAADRKSREADGYRRDGNAAAAVVAAAEATAYGRHCSCVYAAEVRGDAVALRAVAGRPGVRIVDPAPEVRRLDRTVFLPPLPEQFDVVVPPDDSGVAPSTVSAGPG